MISVIEIDGLVLVKHKVEYMWAPSQWMEEVFRPLTDFFESQPPAPAPPSFTVHKPRDRDVVRIILDDDGNEEIRELWNACIAPIMDMLTEHRRNSQ